MSIDFSDYEKGEKFDGDYDAALKKIQERLSRIQAAYICNGARALIVLRAGMPPGRAVRSAG